MKSLIARLHYTLHLLGPPIPQTTQKGLFPGTRFSPTHFSPSLRYRVPHIIVKIYIMEIDVGAIRNEANEPTAVL